jgi:hypothetical protein
MVGLYLNLVRNTLLLKVTAFTLPCKANVIDLFLVFFAFSHEGWFLESRLIIVMLVIETIIILDLLCHVDYRLVES